MDIGDTQVQHEYRVFFIYGYKEDGCAHSSNQYMQNFRLVINVSLMNIDGIISFLFF